MINTEDDVSLLENLRNDKYTLPNVVYVFFIS